MSTILIKETFPDNQSVEIQVDGILDSESFPILEDVCKEHWKNGRKIQLNLEGLIHISREGTSFLQSIGDKVTIVNLLGHLREKS